MPERFQNFIAGAWVDPSSGQYSKSINPASTDDVIGEFPRSPSADAAKAIEAAAEGFRQWGRMSAVARGGYLHKAANWLQQHAEEYAQAMTRENGKAIGEARGEVARCVAILQYYGAEGMNPVGDVVPSANPNLLLYSRRVPLGVVSLITPWNFPLAIPLWKMAPALVYGNTIVLKPATATPHMGVLLAKMWEAVDLPKGVFNLVTGSGGEIGNELITNTHTRAISFTGSTAVGRGIAVEAAKRNKKYQLELGGKNPVLVFEDADLEQAAEITVAGAMKYSGQKCTATSRAIVMSEVMEDFTGLVVDKVKALKIGPGAEAANTVMPVIDAPARDNVLSAVKRAVDEGATVLSGGKAPTTGGLDKGYFVEPTVLGNVRPDAFVACEEIFGPVLALIPASSPEDATYTANSVAYGLSASLFTKNLNAALDFVNNIEAGVVKINGETAGIEPQVPFGGMKDSSSGSREQGKAAIEFFTETKTIYIDRSAT